MKKIIIILSCLGVLNAHIVAQQNTFEIDGDQEAKISIYNGTTLPKAEFGIDNQLEAYLNIGFGQNLDFNYNNINRMSISTSGKLGIGTQEYFDKVNVGGRTETQQFNFYHNDSQRAKMATSPTLFSQEFSLFGFGKMRFITGNNNIAMTLHGKRLGIGTDDPDATLHVLDRTLTGSAVDVLAIGVNNSNPILTLGTGEPKNSMSIDYQKSFGSSDDDTVEQGALIISDPSQSSFMSVDNDSRTYIGRVDNANSQQYTLSVGDDLRVEEYILLEPLDAAPGVCGEEFFFPAMYYDKGDHKLKVCHSRTSDKWDPIH